MQVPQGSVFIATWHAVNTAT